MTESPCPGSCNRAWRIAQAEPDREGAELIEPVVGEPVWCEVCVAEIRRAVRRMPDLAAQLWGRGHHTQDRSTADPAAADWIRVPVPTTDPARLHPWTNIDPRERERPAVDRSGVPVQDTDEGRLSVVRAERGSGAKGSPALSPAWLAIDELVSWAGGVEDKVRARLGLEARESDWWSGRAEHRAAFLSTSVLWLLARDETWALPEAAEWGKQALRLEKQAERLAGRDELIHYLGVCPRCDRKALVRFDGDDTVRCRSCRGKWTEDEWHWMVKVAVAAAKDEEKA